VPLEEKELAKKVSDDLNEVCSKIKEKKIEIKCSYGVGAKMGEIAEANKVYIDGKSAEGTGSVIHEAGQVLLLDFWATWCPPCQGPMKHNQDMLEKRSDWAGKVRLIGLSIDQDAETVKKHVESKGWTSVEHWHIRNGKCVADKEYGISGVPHVALIDKEGKIVFKGHPASRKLEEDIDALLKGEKLTGEGTGPKASDDDNEEKAGGSDTDITEDIQKFEDQTKAFVSEKSKEMSQGC